MCHLTRPNPVCPGCGEVVSSISYSKTFIFVDGVRHGAGWQWILPCCGAYLLDEELEWSHDNEDGILGESALTDKDGNVVMQWLDLVPEAEETDS